MSQAKWPAEMVDSERLFELLGHRVGDRQIIGDEAYFRVKNLQHAIERARDVGRIKRYVARDPASGEVIAYGYRREEIQRILHQGG